MPARDLTSKEKIDALSRIETLERMCIDCHAIVEKADRQAILIRFKLVQKVENGP
jgi:hypothetical protein